MVIIRNAIKNTCSHLRWKVANKCLNNRERVKVIERNKGWSPPFPCCLVKYKCVWKKILIEKNMIVATNVKKFYWIECFWFSLTQVFIDAFTKRIIDSLFQPLTRTDWIRYEASKSLFPQKWQTSYFFIFVSSIGYVIAKGLVTAWIRDSIKNSK